LTGSICNPSTLDIVTFSATGLNVMIASPSDTGEARRAACEAIAEWNDLNAENYGVVLLPLMWETSATPAAGDRPQAILNKQLVGRADILVGIFWTRLGSETGVSESGTVEEIEQCIAAGRSVLIYFSSQPVVPETVDPEQLTRMREFQRRIQEDCLTGKYDSPTHLHGKLLGDLTRTIRGLLASGSLTVPTAPSASGDAVPSQPDRRDLIDGYKRQLRGVVAQYESNWGGMNDGMHTEEARHLMARLAQELGYLIYQIGRDTEPQTSEAYTKLIMASQSASQLSRHRFYMDGGRSWNEFVTGVERIFETLTYITGLDWASPT
jgi:hypothetical protein